MSEPDLGILHLSDLHFGPYLQQTEPYGEWARIPGAYPHHYRLVQGMEIAATQLLKKFQGKVITAITGDMTTAGEPSAYEIVNNYLRGVTYVRSRAKVGLALSDKNIPFFSVPGNHDYWHSAGRWLSKWRQRNRHEDYLKYFPDVLPDIDPIVVNGMSVAIYRLDSNRIQSPWLPWQLENMLGQGEVGEDQLADLQNKHAALVNGAYPNLPAGYNFEKSLRILLLHHHLALPIGVDATKISQRLLVLKDVDKVKTMIRDCGIQVVLCGHQHFPHLVPKLNLGYPKSNVFYACAGSATQVGCEQNSYFFYEISRVSDDELELTPIQFLRRTPPSYVFQGTRGTAVRIKLG